MIKIDIKSISLPVLFILFTFSFVSTSCSAYKDSRTARKKEEKTRRHIVRKAKEYEGTKYRYGGTSPRGFDCSGFTKYVFKKEGIQLDASSKLQSKQGKFKDISDAEPGDLVFFGPPFKIDHVGIVTQNKKGKLHVIHSTNSQGVIEHDVFQILYWKKRLKFARDVISP